MKNSNEGCGYMVFQLTYITETDFHRHSNFRKDAKVIDLSQQRITSIDLSSLSVCSRLKVLKLGTNRLQNVDLEPLSSCVTLEKLGLWGNGLIDIDLGPLASCINLRELWLNHNQFWSINLSPLSSCTFLQKLYVGSSLRSIDLTPLASCTDLQELYLSGSFSKNIDLTPLAFCTSLQTLSIKGVLDIDLSPLKSCSKLKSLFLGPGDLSHLDLTPLKHCKNLKHINLINPLVSIDLTPLSFCKKLETLCIGRFQESLDLDISPLIACRNFRELAGEHNEFVGINPRLWISEMTFFGLMSEYWHDFGIWEFNFGKNAERPSSFWHVFHNLLNMYSKISKYRINFIQKDYSSKNPLLQSFEATPVIFLQFEIAKHFELDYFGLIDKDLRKRLLEIPIDSNYEQIKSSMKKIFTDHLLKNVRRGLPAIGMNIEKALSEEPEIALVVERIVEKRNHEMDDISVPLHGEYADLRPLWCTGYGFRYLFQKGYNLQIHENKLHRIQEDFNKLGFELKTYREESSILSSKWATIDFPSLKISHKLRDCIYILADLISKFDVSDLDELGYKWIG